LVFENRTHQIVVSAIWQWAGVVDVVGADLALLLGDPFSQESSLVKPPAKALRDFGQTFVAPGAALKESNLGHSLALMAS
jgi:hypothetical protein